VASVIDFDLVKAAPARESDITHGEFVGTPAFASPEHFSGAGMTTVRLFKSAHQLDCVAD
jgi:serine/threonine protein kinase